MTAEDREILRLAVPAFLTLIAEPLYLLADSAIIGHLGTTPLAGLSIAGTLLSLATGLCIFLAYGTTATVARHLGAGSARDALSHGTAGLWLGLTLGSLLALLGSVFGSRMVGLFGATPDIADQALAYLSIGVLGLPALLLTLAATGVLRGLQDTRTPLLVAVAANLLNICLNYLLVYGLDLGIAGSALGTVIAQTLGAVVLVAVVLRQARAAGAPLAPSAAELRRVAGVAAPLLVRSLSLQAALTLTTYAASLLADGPRQAVTLATHQIALTSWFFLVYALDAIAIAAQAITGRALGAGHTPQVRAVTSRMVGWGLVSGSVAAAATALASPWAGRLFTADPAVQHLLARTLLVMAIGLPIAGVVFVLDGILIGAGDTRFLAFAQVVVLAAYVPVAAAVAHWSESLPLLWAAFGIGWLLARCALLERRRRGTAWLVTGAIR